MRKVMVCLGDSAILGSDATSRKLPVFALFGPRLTDTNRCRAEFEAFTSCKNSSHQQHLINRYQMMASR